MKEIETENLRIRKPKIEDVEQVYKNIASVKDLMECLNSKVHQNIEETKRMIQSAILECEVGEPMWSIESKKDKEVIGYIMSTKISKKNKRCELSFAMAFKWWDTELLEEALGEVIKYLLLEEFDIVICDFYACSEKTTKYKSKVLENIGMTREAVLRDRRINRETGEKQGLVVYSITKNELK